MRFPDPSALRRYLACIDQGDGFEIVLAAADFFAGGGPQGEASAAEMMRARQGLEGVRAGAEPDRHIHSPCI
ncbi:hypothetical protein [Oceanicella actignis]|uniref:hypothetical protein n=1 Tax=Oceanicella actignis TaxID=1189325 RepID=UPI0011E6905A|nr:hypothetical protein [Oceanicella actignis]TYO90905.1 hypothetical protein LY05_01041 [Oceanicella actignis]